MKKSLLWIILVFFAVIIFIFFIKINYKKNIFGNNESNKSVKEIEAYILNINSYEATLDITVNSNKNSNKYLLKQSYDSKNKTDIQTIIKPENIEGIEIINRNGDVEINNSKLNLSQIYSNYPYLSNNVLWLNAFLEDYKKNSESSKVHEEDEYVVMEVSNGINNYYYTKKLYLEKGTGIPKKMVVQDNNKKDTIYISYREIIINK